MRPYSIIHWLQQKVHYTALIIHSVKKCLNWLGTSCVVSITTVATWHIWTADFWADFEQRQQSNKPVTKRLRGRVNAERRHSNTCCNCWYCKTFYYFDRNTVCLKDLPFLYIRQRKQVEWRAVKDGCCNSLQLVLCCKRNCFLCALITNIEHMLSLKFYLN